MNKDYNGWVNYETWLLALNVDNEQGLYESTRELIKKTRDMEVCDAAKEIKNYLEELTYNEECGIYKICDSLTTS